MFFYSPRGGAGGGRAGIAITRLTEQLRDVGGRGARGSVLAVRFAYVKES